MSRPPAARTLVRLFEMAQALQGPGATAADLALRYSVSVRSIYRSLRTLQDAGLAVFVDDEHRWRVLSRQSTEVGSDV
jgi:predicted DNA-binding transcriptional regulator YafY